MPGITYTNTVFTGAGLKNLSGQRVSFQWFGFAPAPSDGSVPTTLNSVLNGEISVEENTPVQSAPTTAYNGFTTGWNECTTLSGTVEGFIQPSSVVPTVSGVISPFSNGKYYFKMLIGTVSYAGFGYFSGIKLGSTNEGKATVSFSWQLVGLPTASQFDYVRGGSAPPTT